MAILMIKCGGTDEERNIALRDFTRRMGMLEQRRSGTPDRSSWEGLLGEHGTTMAGARLRAEEPRYLETLAHQVYKRGWLSFSEKHCYQNCFRLLFLDDDRRLRYWEGYADVGCPPFQHAWLTINRKVVDPTLDAVDRDGTPSPYRAYFGVEIPRKLVVKLLEERCGVPFITQQRMWDSLPKRRGWRTGNRRPG